MFKKVSTLVLGLVVLLVSAPLVMAAQDTTGQQNDSQNQPAQSGQQNASQTQQTQYPIPLLKDITKLDANNNLVVNCGALVDMLDYFQQPGKDTVANDPNLRLALMQATDLEQLCKADGFTKNGEPPNSSTQNDGKQSSDSTQTNGGQPSGSTQINSEQPNGTTQTNDKQQPSDSTQSSGGETSNTIPTNNSSNASPQLAPQ